LPEDNTSSNRLTVYGGRRGGEGRGGEVGRGEGEGAAAMYVNDRSVC